MNTPQLISLINILFVLLTLWASPSFAATFAATPILENCNRADENPMTNAGQWTRPLISTHPSALICATNLIDRSATAGDGSAYWNVGDFGPDIEVYADVPDAVAGNSFFGLYLAIANPNIASSTDGYSCFFRDQTDDVIVRRVDNSVSTTLTTTTMAFLDGDKLGCKRETNVICAWWKQGAGAWAEVTASCVTDTTYPAAGKSGMLLATTLYSIDNWGSNTISAPPAARRRGPMYHLQ